MTAKLVVAMSLVAALGWTSSALAAGSKEAGQAKAATCSACHGMDGNSLNPEWPNLAGQGEAYLVRQLKAFHSGQRQNVLMSPMAAILSDQDMADLAAFFSSQTVRGGEADPSKFKAGQRLPFVTGTRRDDSKCQPGTRRPVSVTAAPVRGICAPNELRSIRLYSAG